MSSKISPLRHFYRQNSPAFVANGVSQAVAGSRHKGKFPLFLLQETPLSVSTPQRNQPSSQNDYSERKNNTSTYTVSTKVIHSTHRGRLNFISTKGKLAIRILTISQLKNTLISASKLLANYKPIIRSKNSTYVARLDYLALVSKFCIPTCEEYAYRLSSKHCISSLLLIQ